MKPKHLERLAVYAIAHQEPLVVIGGPGTGKTQIVLQSAVVADAEVLPPLYLGMIDPVDMGGMNLPTQPDANGKRRLERLLDDWLEPAFTATRRTVLFLDEIDKGTHAVQCAAAPLFDLRRCGKHKLPDCVAVIGTANAAKHRAGSVQTLTHLISRLSRVYYEVDPLAWLERAVKDHTAPEVISFIKQYPSNLDVSLRPDKGNWEEIYQSGQSYENPRSWYTVSRHIHQGLDRDLEREVFDGVVGEGVNRLFQTHLTLVRESVDIQAALAGGQWKFPAKDKLGARYAFCIGIGSCANQDTADRVIEIAGELYDQKEAEFGEIIVQAAAGSFAGLVDTPAWSTLRKHPMGKTMLRLRRI